MAAHAAGDPCGSDGYPAAGIRDIGANGKNVAHLDDRNYALGNGTWLYLEDHGTQSLQRTGNIALTSGPNTPAVGPLNANALKDQDVCTADGTSGGDTLVF